MNNPVSGQYRTQHAEVTIELEEKDTAAEGFERAQKECQRALGIDVTDAEIRAAEEVLAKAYKAGKRPLPRTPRYPGGPCERFPGDLGGNT